MHIASYTGRVGVAKVLIDKDAEIDIRNEVSGMTMNQQHVTVNVVLVTCDILLWTNFVLLDCKLVLLKSMVSDYCMD